MSKNSIFIQIASYRDPELVPTLDSLFDNAKFPNNNFPGNLVEPILD